MTLSGKKLQYNYGNAVYHLDFFSDSELHWKCIEGDEQWKEDNEKYHTQQLGKDIFFVTWIEADDLWVSQVINLQKNTINCYLKADQEIIPLAWSITILS